MSAGCRDRVRCDRDNAASGATAGARPRVNAGAVVPAGADGTAVDVNVAAARTERARRTGDDAAGMRAGGGDRVAGDADRACRDGIAVKPDRDVTRGSGNDDAVGIVATG